MGDIVHALPVAAALRAAWPDVRVDWLVDVRHRRLLDLTSVLNECITIDTRVWRGADGVPSVLARLRATRYDAALDLQGLVKSAALARLSKAARVIGFARPHLREPLAGRFYTERVDVGGTPHVVDKNLALLRVLSVDHPAKEFPLTAGASPAPAAVRTLLGLDARGAYAVINPGAAWPNKRWPPQRFAELAERMHLQHGLRSTVVWGPDEETLAARIAAASNGAAVMAPRTQLADVLALVKDARIVISGDTGPIHLAAAAGTPIVGIYGPTDPARNGPWSRADVCVSRFDECVCHHKRRCLVERWCLADIDLREVSEAVTRRLEHDSTDGAKRS